MQNIIILNAAKAGDVSDRRPFVFDTTFVLFFLAVDFGNSAILGGLELVLPLITLLMFIAVPYLLPCEGERPEFRSWIVGRGFLAVFGVILGVLFRQVVGPVFPEYFGHLPMTLLIISAIFSSYIQFYAILRLRLAR